LISTEPGGTVVAVVDAGVVGGTAAGGVVAGVVIGPLVGTGAAPTVELVELVDVAIEDEGRSIGPVGVVDVVVVVEVVAMGAPAFGFDKGAMATAWRWCDDDDDVGDAGEVARGVAALPQAANTTARASTAPPLTSHRWIRNWSVTRVRSSALNRRKDDPLGGSTDQRFRGIGDRHPTTVAGRLTEARPSSYRWPAKGLMPDAQADCRVL
jgi:hypothetical protein